MAKEKAAEKKYMYCTKCGEVFLTKSKTPRCPECRSVLVTDYKNVSAKEDVLKLNPRVAELERDVAHALEVSSENRNLIRKIIKSGR